MDVINHFNTYKFDNIKRLFVLGFLIYILMAFIDYSLAKKDLPVFLGFRFIGFLPYFLIMIFTFQQKSEDVSKRVDLFGFLIFSGLAFGASFCSYFLGGLSSDYYFGIVVISFAQFLTMPQKTSNTILMEILFIFIYFPLNFFPFEHETVLLTKQLSNYLSYSLIKIAVSGRFVDQIQTSFQALELNKKIEKQNAIQMLFGELCHLLNNPLFISTSLIKKIQRNQKELLGTESERDDFQKALDANNRMKEILHEMMRLQSEKEINFQENQYFKDYWKNQ